MSGSVKKHELINMDSAHTQALVEQSIKNTEQFRAKAIDSLAQFTEADRQMAVGLSAPGITVTDVLKVWTDDIKPVREHLAAKRTEVKFKKSLVAAIGLSAAQTQDAIDNMVADRIADVLTDCITKLYPLPKGTKDNYESQRTWAAQLFAMSDHDIAAFAQRHEDYLHYTIIAERQHVTICDPYGSWLERQRCARQIRKERQKTIEEENARLAELTQQIANLETSHDGLVGDMVAKSWDFMKVIDLRQQYEKKLAALPAAQRKSPAKQLRIFDAITHDFRDHETEKLAKKAAPQAKLKVIRGISEDIDRLLVTIFDLDNADKNKLLLDMQTHKKLAQERDMLLLIQNNRDKYLTEHQQ